MVIQGFSPIAPEARRSYIRSSEGTQWSPRRGKKDFRNAVCVQCAALFPRALRVIQGFSAMPRKHPFSTERSFSRTVLATRGCSHEGLLRRTHLRGAKNVCSEPRAVLTMASGCPGRFRSAEGAGTRNPSAAPIEKDAGEERGSFRKPRYSGSSA